MSLMGRSGVFGTKTRTNILLLLTLLQESHAAELARLAGVRLYTAQSAIDSLEQAGLVVGVLSGRERRVRLNPRFYAFNELRALLERMASSEAELRNRVAELRRRPRRAGKKL